MMTHTHKIRNAQVIFDKVTKLQSYCFFCSFLTVLLLFLFFLPLFQAAALFLFLYWLVFQLCFQQRSQPAQAHSQKYGKIQDIKNICATYFFTDFHTPPVGSCRNCLRWDLLASHPPLVEAFTSSASGRNWLWDQFLDKN